MAKKTNRLKTLDNFILGKSNLFAFKIIESIPTSNLLGSFLILYGKAGTGKSHLLEAIKNMPKIQDKNIIYMKSELFMNDFIDNTRHKSMDTFQNRYRHCDLLLIDDIQFFAYKEDIQEELYHTVEALMNSGKTIVFVSNKYPKYLFGFSEYLKSQLLRALSIKIKVPKKKIIIAVTKQKTAERGISLNEKTIKLIVNKSDKNIHFIEDLIMKLKAHYTLFNKDITFKIAKKILINELNQKNKTR